MLEKLKMRCKSIYEFNWKLFFTQVYKKSRENDIFIHAMGMVYITMLSLVPFLIFAFYIVSLFDFFGRIDVIIEEVREIILANLATGTGDALLEYLENLAVGVDIEQLGVVSFATLVIVIITMLARIEVTFNEIWGVEEHRDIFKRFVAFWTFITLGTFIVTVGISLGFTFLENYLDFGIIDAGFAQDSIFRLIIFSANFLIFVFAYYFIPNIHVEPLSALFAGVVSGGGFLISREIYSIYTRNIVTYSQIYGSLSIIPIFLIWLYLIWLIVLFGAVISYVFHHRDSLVHLKAENKVNQRLQELLPAAILIILYKNYLQQEKPGVTYEEILQKIQMPDKTIKDHINKLKRDNLIARTEENNFVPKKRIDNLPLISVCNTEDLEEDFEIEEIFSDREMKSIYRQYKQGIRTGLGDKTLGEIVAENQ